jgi:hypothetical protein
MALWWAVIGGVFLALFLGYGSAEVQGHAGLLVGSLGAFAIALRSLRA